MTTNQNFFQEMQICEEKKKASVGEEGFIFRGKKKQNKRWPFLCNDAMLISSFIFPSK